MDYVVFGIGFGATILVLGLLLRDFGPRARFRKSRDGSELLSAEELVGKVSWSRFCTALGSVLALAGAVFLLITLVAMVLVVSDDTGLWVMSAAFGLLMVLIAFWTWAYFDRFGSYGILPERVEAEPEPARPAEPAAEAVIVGPPVPAAADDETEDEAVVEVSDEATVEEPAELAGDPDPQVASDTIVEAGDEDEGAEASAEDMPADPGVDSDAEATAAAAMDAPRLETPEERLAHADSPIDHGSVEGDLDLAAAGPRRPGSPGQRREDTDAPAPPDDPADDTADAAMPIDRDRA